MLLNLEVSIAYDSLVVTRGIATAMGGVDRDFFLTLTGNENTANELAKQAKVDREPIDKELERVLKDNKPFAITNDGIRGLDE